MTVQLSEALRELADDRPPSAGSLHDTEAARGAWGRSRVVRRRRRVAGAAVAVVAALLVVPAVSSLSGLRAEQPLPGEVPGVVGVPDRVYASSGLFRSVSKDPVGPASLVVANNDSTIPQVVLAGGSDAYRLLTVPSVHYAEDPVGSNQRIVALSRDGRQAAIVQTVQETSGGPIVASVTVVNLTTGESEVVSYPGVVLEAAVFSPDGARLGLGGLLVTDVHEGGYGGIAHTFVQGAEGTAHDLGVASSVLGWTPGGELVISGWSPTGKPAREETLRTVAVAFADDVPGPPRDLGPAVDAGIASGGASALSPDGRLLATVSRTSNSIDGSDPFTLEVSKLGDGTVVRKVDWIDLGAVSLVGWQDATTPVVAIQQAWGSNAADPFQLVAETSSGPQVLTVAAADAQPYQVAAAQGLLATVRSAAPPENLAWYRDWPSVATRVSGWFGMTPSGLRTFLFVIGLIALPIVLVLLNNRRVKRRDPEAYIR